MTQRRRLDHFLAERAQEAGADFRDGVRVEVESDTKLRLDGTPVEVDTLVGADGANGVTARTLGLGGDIVPGVALEGNVPHGVVSKDEYRGRMVIELAILAGGYGWIFPLRHDEYNIGCGVFYRDGVRGRVNLRRMFDRFVETFPDARDLMRGALSATPLKGAPLQCGLAAVEPVVPRVLPVGETISTTFPLPIGRQMISGS